MKETIYVRYTCRDRIAPVVRKRPGGDTENENAMATTDYLEPV